MRPSQAAVCKLWTVEVFFVDYRGMTMTHETRQPPPPIDSVSDSADAGRMEKRIDKLESSLAAIELDVGILKATSATKSDLAEAKTTIILWIVTAVILAQILPGLLRKFGLM